MKNSAIKRRFVILFFAFCCSTVVAQNKPTDIRFIGFNGGGDSLSNTSDFEDELNLFQNFFPAGSSKLLNAGGSESKPIAVDRFGYVERSFSGDVIFKSSSIRRSAEATKANLDAAVQDATKYKPKAVTMYFTDHGGEKELAAWNEDITYETIKKYDDKFDPTTVVRRIHFHCYAGRAISPRADVSKSGDLLKMYPENRCDLASSAADEVSYGFDFEDPVYPVSIFDRLRGAPATPGEVLLKRPESPSLANLKVVLVDHFSYSANPKLTSDLFLNDLSKKICGYPTGPTCNAADNLSAQFSKLKSIVTGEFCTRVAKTAENRKKQTQSFNTILERYRELSLIQSDVTLDYAKKKYPDIYAKWAAGVKARDQLIRCETIPSKPCKDVLAMKVAASENAVDDFYRKLASLKMPAGPHTTIPFFGSNDEANQDPAYIAALDKKLKEYINRKGSKLSDKDSFSFLGLRRSVSRNLDDLQIESKKDLERQESAIRTDMEFLLIGDESSLLLKRLQNIQACENSPIDSGLKIAD